MALFEYKAIAAGGKKVSGRLEASTVDEVKGRLREQGLTILSVTTKITRSRGETLKGDQLARFTTLLGQLVDAGVPLHDSLELLEEQYRGEKGHPILVSLSESIKAGSSLSDALSSHPTVFPKLYIAMITAGEATGQLAPVLQRLARYLEQQNKIRKSIINALIYPGAVLIFASLVVVLLLTFVIPSMSALFEGREVGGYTRLVLGTSEFLRSYWLPLLTCTIAIGVALTWWLRTLKGKLALQRVATATPLLGSLMTTSATARFSRTMGALLDGEVAAVEALTIARGVVGNVRMAADLELAEKAVLNGRSISDALRRVPLLPTMVARMVSVGEESGQLALMFHRIADIHEDTLSNGVTRLTALAQPVILLVVGAIIGLILMGVLLPLSDLASLSQ